jgi:SAM-dependent methyltransferase
MLAVARELAAAQSLPQLSFDEADASAADLPSDCDLLFSRFGVMFFSRPAVALGHLRGALRPGGRFVFVCWRAPRDNPWAMAALVAARAAMGVTPAPSDPNAPGPFAFADDSRLASLLDEAGFEAIDLRRLDAPVRMGASPRGAAESALRVGPVSRLVRELGSEHVPLILDAVERAFNPLAATDGSVYLAGSSWIVRAANPG